MSTFGLKAALTRPLSSRTRCDSEALRSLGPKDPLAAAERTIAAGSAAEAPGQEPQLAQVGSAATLTVRDVPARPS